MRSESVWVFSMCKVDNPMTNRMDVASDYGRISETHLFGGSEKDVTFYLNILTIQYFG